MKGISCKVFSVLALLFVCVHLMGCGGSRRPAVQMRFFNLGPLSSGFRYTAWAKHAGTSVRLADFFTGGNESASITRYAILDTLENGDTIFVTIESTSGQTPSANTVLTGTVDGKVAGSSTTVDLSFPATKSLERATAFVTVNGTQVLAEYANLPNVSGQGFIYQGFLERSGIFTPLTSFAGGTPSVQDTVAFNPATARFVLTIRPISGGLVSKPYSAQPFFSGEKLLSSTKVSLTNAASASPGDVDFRLPFGTAVID